MTFSIGVATYPDDGADQVGLDAAAQRALTRAAELGGNRTVLHSVPADVPPGWGLSAAARYHASAATTLTADDHDLNADEVGRPAVQQPAKATSWTPKSATSTRANRVRASERKW